MSVEISILTLAGEEFGVAEGEPVIYAQGLALSGAFSRQELVPLAGRRLGLLHYSYQGSPYTANDFRERLRHSQAVESSSRKGNVWDNAAMASFFSTLEMEWLRQQRFQTRAGATQEGFIDIEIFYNRQRTLRDSALGGLSPAEFEAVN